MSRFKVGDLALVVRCDQIPENVGCVVELVKFLRKDTVYSTPGGELRNALADCWMVVGRVTGMARRPDGSIFQEFGHALFAEKHLMPLRGDFTPEREKSSEVPV